MTTTPRAALGESVPLLDSPTDGITALSYIINNSSALTSSAMLASTSWDGSVRIHDTRSRKGVLSHVMDSGPILSLCCPVGGKELVTGGLDGSVRMLDISSSSYQVIGRHSSNNASGSNNNVACSCLESLNSSASSSSPTLVASAGWHGYCHLWDARQSACVVSIPLPGKAFGMDYDSNHNRLVLITSGRRTCVVDIRNPIVSSELVLDRESSLKYQTRCLRCFPDGTGIAIGSIEGRVAVEFLDELRNDSNETSRKKYAFKCHRVGNTVYPVNCIDFHPRFGTFATGGCDGTVVMWDGRNKKKLTTLPKLPTSIAALTFNWDGSELAIASSYTFEEGEREHPKDEIYIRQMLDSECQPKVVTN